MSAPSVPPASVAATAAAAAPAADASEALSLSAGGPPPGPFAELAKDSERTSRAAQRVFPMKARFALAPSGGFSYNPEHSSGPVGAALIRRLPAHGPR